jgi:hypothetical protein
MPKVQTGSQQHGAALHATYASNNSTGLTSKFGKTAMHVSHLGFNPLNRKNNTSISQLLNLSGSFKFLNTQDRARLYLYLMEIRNKCPEKEGLDCAIDVISLLTPDILRHPDIKLIIKEFNLLKTKLDKAKRSHGTRKSKDGTWDPKARGKK